MLEQLTPRRQNIDRHDALTSPGLLAAQALARGDNLFCAPDRWPIDHLAINGECTYSFSLGLTCCFNHPSCGRNIVVAGQVCKTIPQLFMYSVQLGYQRNELQDNLYSLADMYTEQTRVSQSRLQTLFLPIMLIFVGGVIAFAVIALFMPMVKLLDDVSKS